jgi:predicted transglutaminase-like cysteine proteinase
MCERLWTPPSPTLAPFQHVRFVFAPSDCKSDPTENERIDLNAETSELLKRINHSVNVSIIPTIKSYGQNLGDGWTIGPDTGDCNDYAVTRRHEFLESGALRLSVVKTASGIGHLVLVLVTTKGDIVLDNLTEVIRRWQSTDYHWLKVGHRLTTDTCNALEGWVGRTGRTPAGQGPSGSSAPGKQRKRSGTCRGERKANAARGLDDTGSDFQETKTQRRELGSGQFLDFGNGSRTVSINQ